MPLSCTSNAVPSPMGVSRARERCRSPSLREQKKSNHKIKTSENRSNHQRNSIAKHFCSARARTYAQTLTPTRSGTHTRAREYSLEGATANVS